MYRELLADATFHNLLLACDRDLAEEARAGRCSLCGGVLHSATYPRKPRGRPMKLGPDHDRRFSFCCGVDGCRSRATPPSLRFLGPKVYLATIVVLVSIMRHGATPTRQAHRTQKKSDGSIVIEGRRFEVPNRYRHLARIEVRYASWDLSAVHLVDERTGNVLARLRAASRARCSPIST